MLDSVAFTLAQLAETLDARLQGDGSKTIHGLAALQHAGPSDLSFLANRQYRKQLAGSQAGAVLLTEADAADFAGNALIVADPYLAYAQVSHQFDRKPRGRAGIHPSAVIAESVVVDATACIGPGVVIEAHAVIGANATLGAQCFVGERCHIGADSWLAPRVTLYHDVRMGERVVIQSGAVIGGEGFGFANADGRWHKIAQIGGVVIGDDVEIGANTTIDRGALSDTVINDGVKLDNQIQIAHNVQVGEHTAMAACVGISGSTRIGKHCMLAGGVGLVGHIDVCDNVFISGMTMVTRSITEPGAYSSGTAMQTAADWKKSAARFRQLDTLARRVQQLEKQLLAVTPPPQDSSES
ncbi:MAG: UDP-3-O-(3-hydroxymyristoyl)glucosamine N-acyltransferase [Pseudomonas sp.]